MSGVFRWNMQVYLKILMTVLEDRLDVTADAGYDAMMMKLIGAPTKC